MAILKVINGNHNYTNDDAKEILIEYILNPYKAIHGYIGGVGVSPDCPAESMQIVSERFHKADGVQLRHYIISFDLNEVKNPKIANEIACQAAKFIGLNYQVVFAVHENKEYLHIHLIANTVSYIDGHRYTGKYAEFFEMKNHFEQILKHYGISKLIYEPKR